MVRLMLAPSAGDINEGEGVSNPLENHLKTEGLSEILEFLGRFCSDSSDVEGANRFSSFPTLPVGTISILASLCYAREDVFRGQSFPASLFTVLTREAKQVAPSLPQFIATVRVETF